MMLNYLRRTIKGKIAWIIVIIIVIPFALFGIGEYLGAPSDLPVASVSGNEILKSDFDNLYQNRKRELEIELDQDYTEELDKQLKQAVIRRLINDEVLVAYAQSLDLSVSTEELRASIAGIPDFQDDEGRFSLEHYRRTLRLSGLTPASFETLQREGLLRDQLVNNLLESDFIADQRQHILDQVLKQQRKFSYLRINIFPFFGQVEVASPAIQKYYDENKESYIEPRQAKVDYLLLSVDTISNTIEISEEALEQLYEERKNNTVQEEERRAQHILVADQSLADSLYQRIIAGESFDSLAKEYSEDVGSKEQGGDLGFFTKGVMVAPFEQAVFALEIDEVSQPVKSEFGYHIIRLTDIQSSEIEPFEVLKDELIATYKTQEAERKLYALSEELANTIYDNDALDEVGAQFGLELNTTEFFSESDIDKYPFLTSKFIRSAFSDEVFEQQSITELIESKENEFVVMRLNDKKLARDKTFEEVRGSIGIKLRQDKARELALEQGRAIENQLKAGNSDAASALIAQAGLQWTSEGWHNRPDQPEENQTLIDLVFLMQKPQGGQPTYALSQTDLAILLTRLEEVRIDPTPEQDRTVSLIWQQARSEAINRAILSLLISDAEVEIYDNPL